MFCAKQEPSLFSRSGRARQYRLLDAQRAARDKYGSEAAMLRQARRNREAAQRFHKTGRSGQVQPACSAAMSPR